MAKSVGKIFALLHVFVLCCASHSTEADSCASSHEDVTSHLQLHSGSQHSQMEDRKDTMSPWCLTITCQEAKKKCRKKDQCCDYAKHCKTPATTSTTSTTSTTPLVKDIPYLNIPKDLFPPPEEIDEMMSTLQQKHGMSLLQTEAGAEAMAKMKSVHAMFYKYSQEPSAANLASILQAAAAQNLSYEDLLPPDLSLVTSEDKARIVSLVTSEDKARIGPRIVHPNLQLEPSAETQTFMEEHGLNGSLEDLMPKMPTGLVDLKRSKQRAACDGENDPKSEACLALIKCPVVALLVKGGFIKPEGAAGMANQTNLMDGVIAGLDVSQEIAFLTTFDSVTVSVGTLPLFHLPSNHIGNTGIRSHGFVNATAFEWMWEKFSNTHYGQPMMCQDEMLAAGDYYRDEAIATIPGLPEGIYTEWKGTVYGAPVQRDITKLTMVALPLLFSSAATPLCLNKTELSMIYLDSTAPCSVSECYESQVSFLEAAELAGGIANAKWQVNFFPMVFYMRIVTGLMGMQWFFSWPSMLVMLMVSPK